MSYRNILTKTVYAFCIAVLILALGCACCKAEKAGDVNVMSFNIRYGTANDGQNSWNNRREIVFGVIRKYSPDIVGLQEALNFQIEQIRKAAPGYAMIGVGREDGKTKGEYSAILYRKSRFEVEKSGTFWLSDTPEVPGSITWGNACTRICTWARFVEKDTGRAFYHFNLHLDHISQPSREKSMLLLVERIKARRHADPFVVTGDFNAGERNKAILFLKAKTTLEGPNGNQVGNSIPMVDTFRVVQPDAKRVATFNRFKGGDAGSKIDYILTTADIKVLDAQIIRDNTDGRYPSDHFPVTARLAILAQDSSARAKDTAFDTIRLVSKQQ
ncbi:MAG: endonuclease/exonuclease/phosphatase family protein [Sedimentisphaerales bacterium]|nr:endonuclease/exonuclease/phosphatase family protein [Sedimentisphaerales bacterium]